MKLFVLALLSLVGSVGVLAQGQKFSQSSECSDIVISEVVTVYEVNDDWCYAKSESLNKQIKSHYSFHCLQGEKTLEVGDIVYGKVYEYPFADILGNIKCTLKFNPKGVVNLF